MRNSNRCPKCDARQIWQVREVSRIQDDSPYWRVKMPIVGVTLAMDEQEAARSGNTPGFKHNVALGGFSACICASCGYTEWYAQQLDELSKAASQPGSGVTLLEQPVTPYR